MFSKTFLTLVTILTAVSLQVKAEQQRREFIPSLPSNPNNPTGPNLNSNPGNSNLNPNAGNPQNQFQPQGQSQPNNNNNEHQVFFESFPVNAIAEPRMGTSLWNPFKSYPMSGLIVPSITAIGMVVALYSFSQITEWLYKVIASTWAKSEIDQEEKKKAEDTNEVEDARKKRMISAQETLHVVSAIEAGEKAYTS